MPNTTYGTPYVASSDLVSAYPGVSSNLATRLDQVSYAGNGLNNQTGTAYTLVLTDVGKTITLSNAAAVTVTIPANASVAAPVGSIVRFCNLGAGTVTIQPTGGVTLNGGNLTLAQFAAVQIVKLATDTWGVVESVGGAGLPLITAQSFSSVASVSVNSCFTATYANYRVVLDLVASVDVLVNMRLRASGSDNTSANYDSTYIAYRSGATSTGGGTGASTILLGDAHTAGSAFLIDVTNPQTAIRTGVTGVASCRASDNIRGYSSATIMTVTTSYDGFTVYPNTGTITGTLRVYGYRNS